ncbi:MAG: TIGR03960 family B12-binding radical SAM protein [Corallococcus sp.]|nr:TIGR03960 family B12-binding radical SAM protein [Corallococcus sp.]
MTKFTDAVKKPYAYGGGEYGSANTSKRREADFCICVSDSYEVGMSNLGVRILYYLFNSLDGVVCERCFAPWKDYAQYLKSQNSPLASLETHKPLKDFDFLGFSMQFELCYSNFFYMLELAGIPVVSEQRGDDFPIVAAGGPCAVNLEPMYKYLDMVFVGEGETPWKAIMEDYKSMKAKGASKREFLQYVHSAYDCIYVPSLQGIKTDGANVVSLGGKKVCRNVEADLNTVFTPDKQIVPNIELVHDRAVAELFRGCANGCRFCQAGIIYRPVRERSVQSAFDLCRRLVESTGYDELSLNSLSTSDYSGLSDLLDKLLPYAKENKLQLNLPSLRLDRFDGKYVSGNRKSSLTFAPEAGSQRLRNVINKNITEEDIFGALTKAFDEGYSSVKLYFMLGLPTETQEDVEGIYNLAAEIKNLYRKQRGKKDVRISVSCSTFIPKPFTPFQWEAFADERYIRDSQRYLADNLRAKGIGFSYNDYNTSLTEAVLARGGRDIADSLYDAYKNGAMFDAWSEYFDWEHYRSSFQKNGVNVAQTVGAKPTDALLPWDYIDVGVDKSFLLREREKAYKEQTTPSCSKQCNNCGLNKRGFCKDTHGNAKVAAEGKKC